MAALNGVTVCDYAYDENGRRSKEPIGRRKVPLTLGHKTRQLAEAIQVNGHTRIPVIAVTMTSFALDTTRNESKLHVHLDSRWDGTDGYMCYQQPTPVNIGYNVSILTAKGSEMEEIMLHYMSVFNPEIQVSWMNPLVPEELVSRITWDGTANPDFPIETNSDEKIRYKTDMSFTLKGWVFGERKKNVESLNKIEFNVGLLSGCDCGTITDDMCLDRTFIESVETDIHTIEPECVDGGNYVTIYGKNLSEIEGVYLQNLSGSDIPTSSFEPFCFSESLSADCPAFEGYPLDYSVLDYNTITIKTPDVEDQIVDILVTNRHGGCSKLSESKFCGQKHLNIK